MNEQTQPLVSVVCLCYNHQDYVVAAMESVLGQDYPNIELIVVDDASRDDSRQVITAYLQQHPQVQFIALAENAGNCRAFNVGWRASSGDYIIDLAADDMLLPGRAGAGVRRFRQAGPGFGVNFTDAQLIDQDGRLLGQHFTGDFFSDGRVPEGYIFTELLAKYFINPVTMMYSREMLDYLGGYDESLAYEDFDLWVRSAKKFKYCYTPEVLVAKRKLAGSHGHGQYRPGSAILASTLKVCKKALPLCAAQEEYQALLARIGYEMKMAFFSLNWPVALGFLRLQRQVRSAVSAAGF